MKKDFEIYWCPEKFSAKDLAIFFKNNVDINYISHGEVQDGRATLDFHWHPELEQILEREFNSILVQRTNCYKFNKIAVVFKGNLILAMAVLEINLIRNADNNYAILHDLIVDKNKRNLNIGSALLNWIEHELKKLGVKCIFLESGTNNIRAHSFFENYNYKKISSLFMKKLNNS